MYQPEPQMRYSHIFFVSHRRFHAENICCKLPTIWYFWKRRVSTFCYCNFTWKLRKKKISFLLNFKFSHFSCFFILCIHMSGWPSFASLVKNALCPSFSSTLLSPVAFSIFIYLTVSVSFQIFNSRLFHDGIFLLLFRTLHTSVMFMFLLKFL